MAITDDTLRLWAESKTRVRGITDQHMVELTRQWVDAWDVLAPEFSRSLLEVLDTGYIPASAFAKNRRLTAALKQARAAIDELTAGVSVTVSNDLGLVVLDAAETHVAAGTTQLPANPGVALTFSQPHPEALAAIVERTTQQIHAKSLPLAPDVEREMKRQLIRGVAVGANPNVTASRIIRNTEGAFNGGLTRAVRIARTETLDAYRQADLTAATQNKDLLTGWVWVATFDNLVCGSCLANHGTVHDVDEFGPNDHQNGRCTRVDKTKSWRELGFDIDEPEDEIPDAETWFQSLTPDSQAEILGAKRRDLLNNGDIQFSDLTTLRKNEDWRDSMTLTPLSQLVP